MMNRVWKLGLAALCGYFAACTNDNGTNTAGSSMETENSIALLVQLADGTPASRVKVRVRPDSFLAGADSIADSLASEDLNFETNDSGSLVLDNLGYGSYIVEAKDDSLKGASKFNYGSWQIDGGRVSLHIGTPGAVSGQVILEDGEDAGGVLIAVQGLDYGAETDSLGNFEFKSLPSGFFEMVAFVHEDSVIKDAKGDKQIIHTIRKLGSSNAKVESGKHREVVIDGRPWDTVFERNFVLDDFEDGVDAWVVEHSKDAHGNLDLDDAGADRAGKAAHFICSNDSLYNWALIRYNLGGFADLSELDSVTFWARMAPVQDTSKHPYISFSFDTNVDSTSALESGKAWVHIDVDTQWRRYVVKPAELLEPDSAKNGGNIGWDAVKNRISDLSIFGGTGGEYWFDDIKVYGYGKFTVRETPEDLFVEE